MNKPHDRINEDDFFEPELTAGTSETTSKQIIETFNELVRAEQEAEEVSAVLEGLTSKISKIKQVTLPDLLKEMGTEIWRDPETGIAVELELSVNSSLPKDHEKRNAVLDALRPLGVEEIMVEEFTVTFSPNDKRAHAVRALLGLNPPQVLDDEEDDNRLTNYQTAMIQGLRVELGLMDLPADEKLGAHAARLKSWLKEKIEKGFGKAISDAGIWYGKQAKLVRPKTPRAKKG